MTDSIRLGVKGAILQDNQILLVEYLDHTGLHYNLPGGGIEPGESVQDALVREVKEETNCDVRVGRLLLVSEYRPQDHDAAFGQLHKLTLFFLCQLEGGSRPGMPEQPDTNQIGLKWFPLDDLPQTLLPLFHELLVEAIAHGAGRNPFTRRK